MGAKPSVPLPGKPGAPGVPGGPRKSNAVYQAVQKMKGTPEKATASAAKGTPGQVNIRKSGAVAAAVAKMRSGSTGSAGSAAVAKTPVKGTVASANGGAGGRTKVLPNRVTGKVKEWKGAFGWIMPDAKIAHPGAQKHGGKIYLAHEDVEAELSGVGATVSFFVYSDGNGLGAMNVRPGTATKPVSNTPVGNKPGGNKPVGNKPAAQKPAVPLKTTAKKPFEKAKKATGAKPGQRERITEDAVMGEIVEFKEKICWIKLSEPIDGIDEDKDLYCAREDVAEGCSKKKGTVVTCHVYKDAKGFGAEEVEEA